MVRERVQELVRPGEVSSMAVGVRQPGQVLWEVGFGLVDKQQDLAVGVQTPFRLASLSKPSTATLLMRLVGEGVLNHVDTGEMYYLEGLLPPECVHILV